MAAVQAYVDLKHFGVLPRAGGTFDQDAELMDDLRLVSNTVEAARTRERERLEREAKRKSRSGKRGARR